MLHVGDARRLHPPTHDGTTFIDNHGARHRIDYLLTDEHWAPPFAKYKRRVVELAGVGAPTSTSIHMYRSYAISVLSYVAQFTSIRSKVFRDVEQLATSFFLGPAVVWAFTGVRTRILVRGSGS